MNRIVDSRSLIVELLLHDMQYHQLITAITKAGFINNLHGSDLVNVVAGLMDIAEDDISWEWFEAYMNFIFLAVEYEITGDGKNLVPLAETCYTYLTALVIKKEV